MTFNCSRRQGVHLLCLLKLWCLTHLFQCHQLARGAVFLFFHFSPYERLPEGTCLCLCLFLKYTFQAMINSGWCQLVTEQAMQEHVAPLFASVESLWFPQRQHLLLEGLCLYKTELCSGCLSNKYSFTAGAFSATAFFLHWCFSIQGLSKGQKCSYARIYMIDSVGDATFPICPQHIWLQVNERWLLVQSFQLHLWSLGQALVQGFWMKDVLKTLPKEAASAQQPFRLYLQKSTARGRNTLVGDCRERQ